MLLKFCFVTFEGVDSFSSTWPREILNQIMANTPHNWSPNTLANFPPSLAEFFQSQPQHRDDKNTLKRNVEAEYKKWKSKLYCSDKSLQRNL